MTTAVSMTITVTIQKFTAISVTLIVIVLEGGQVKRCKENDRVEKIDAWNQRVRNRGGPRKMLEGLPRLDERDANRRINACPVDVGDDDEEELVLQDVARLQRNITEERIMP